ncbi:SDR family oxidoreductase [Lysobacter soli]|uniref:SDR family oxidoreductase n=1 Tax=Lysobacter soli TaxID=453783 RepID=UPI0037C951F4
MKIVVAGGTGLVGTRLVTRLREGGHEVVSSSRRTGVDVVTGDGLDAALNGASIVIDVTNAPSFDEPDVTDFFRTATRTLLDAGERAGIAHHVALSVVGTSRLQASAYFRAKQVQEDLVRASRVPHTLVRATQFFEFMASIIPRDDDRDPVPLSTGLVEPVAADDVAAQLVDIVVLPPSAATIEIAGPDTYRLNELVQWVMYSYQDDRPVIADPTASYYGGLLDDRTLTPGPGARIAPTHFRDWLSDLQASKIEIPHVHHPDPIARRR